MVRQLNYCVSLHCQLIRPTLQPLPRKENGLGKFIFNSIVQQPLIVHNLYKNELPEFVSLKIENGLTDLAYFDFKILFVSKKDFTCD